MNTKCCIKVHIYLFMLLQYASTVKALIDAGTCADVESTSNCGDDAEGYYETFEYNGQRVIIVSGAPNHAAESELFLSDGYFNPNSRCKRMGRKRFILNYNTT